MRKRSTKEILQLVEVSDTDPLALSGSGDTPSKKPKTPEERKAEREAEIAAQRKRESEDKHNVSAARVDKLKSSAALDRTKDDEIKKDSQRKAELAKAKGRKRALEGQAKKVASRENLRKTIAGGKPKLQTITRKDGSATATGKAAANLVKTGASLVRKTAAIPANIAKQKAKAKLGRMQMNDGRPPDSGTFRQKIGYGAREAGKDIRKTGRNTVRRTNINVEKAKRKVSGPVGSAVKATRNVASTATTAAANLVSRGKPRPNPGMNRIRTAVKDARNTVSRATSSIADRIKTKKFNEQHLSYTEFAMFVEDYIWEAEKNDKKKKETIDVMKGTNKVEVNPKMQAEAKKMTKKQIKKRDEIADAISTREMNKRYGDKNVKYAIATKLAMEAKVDDRKIFGVTADRNERRFGRKGAFDPQGSGPRGQDPSERAKLAVQRGEEHRARRGVKTKGVKEDVTLQDANGNDFVQIVDLIKPEPLVKARSVQEISECWKTHKQVGYKKKGGRMVPNCVPKNEEVENEKTINEISGELASKAFKAANKKYQYADNNLNREKAYKQQQKFAVYANKKYKKLNKDRGDLNKIYNKPDAVKEANAPVQGLMKLAATVAANNKKRKNALQIQKYIGEETPDAISGKDLKRISALSGKKTRFGDGPEGTAKRKAALEKKRGMKLDDHPQFKTEGTIVEKQGGDKKNPDSRINYRTNYTQDRELNSNPDLENFERRQRSKLENQREEKRKKIQQKKENRRQQREGGNTDT